METNGKPRFRRRTDPAEVGRGGVRTWLLRYDRLSRPFDSSAVSLIRLGDRDLPATVSDPSKIQFLAACKPMTRTAHNGGETPVDLARYSVAVWNLSYVVYAVGGVIAAIVLDVPLGDDASGSTVFWQATDPQGTATVSENPNTGVVGTRPFDAFGNARGGGSGSWSGDRGFLNAPTDPFSSLTHLGARDYNSALGRFESVDSILQPGNPQQNNGYAYAWNNPVTMSDPSGLRPACFDSSNYCDNTGNSSGDGRGGGGYRNPNACAAANGGDYVACNVGNSGSSGGSYYRDGL